MRPITPLLIVVFLCSAHARADVRLPRIFTDHMIIQQEKPIRVWGWADKGEVVTVSFNSRSATTITNTEGQWLVELPAMKVDGEEHTLTVKGANTITLKHLKLGEV